MTTAVALHFQAANVSQDVTHVLARTGQGTAAQQARQVKLQRQNQGTPVSMDIRLTDVQRGKIDRGWKQEAVGWRNGRLETNIQTERKP